MVTEQSFGEGVVFPLYTFDFLPSSYVVQRWAVHVLKHKLTWGAMCWKFTVTPVLSFLHRWRRKQLFCWLRNIPVWKGHKTTIPRCLLLLLQQMLLVSTSVAQTHWVENFMWSDRKSFTLRYFNKFAQQQLIVPVHSFSRLYSKSNQNYRAYQRAKTALIRPAVLFCSPFASQVSWSAVWLLTSI